MSTEESRRAAADAQAQAEKQLRRVIEQKPLIDTEVQTLRFLLAENNFAARLRQAMRLRFGGH